MTELITSTPPWLDRDIYPFAHRYMETEEGRLHYIEEGSGRPIIFVHGTPTWSFLYRHLVADLAQDYRCIALDHLGFGLSDKPASGAYHPRDHSRRLAAFIDHLQLRDVILVVHDFGGPIGLSYAVKHSENIAGLVIFNTWMWSEAEDPSVVKLSRFVAGPIGRFLYKWLNFSPRVLLKMGFSDKKKLTRAIHAHYLRPFSKPSERFGPWTLGCELASTWYDEIWERRAQLSEIPTMLVWGMEDPTFKERHLQRLEEVFHNGESLRLDDVGHFPQEEAPREAVVAIRALSSRIDRPVEAYRTYD